VYVPQWDTRLSWPRTHNVLMLYCVESGWPATGDGGECADASAAEAVCPWLWGRWWPLSSDDWQVQNCREASVYSTVVSMLVLATDSDWLAAVIDSALVPTSTEETDWT